jgi:undecaprenyl diphosphate synthase
MSENNKNIPCHVAIIPDGNRRWAKAKGLKPWDGHEEGAKNIEKIVRYALEKDIKCMTFWGSSIENLEKRPIREKQALLDIYARYFRRLIDSEEIYKYEARINIIGHWEKQFPESLKKILKDGIERTKNFQKKSINFMLAYSGTDDMLQAVRRIADEKLSGKEINERLIKSRLMTSAIPAVDFLIRTGNEPHLSAGFMMWDIADAQLFFSEEMFPDFGPEKFAEALDDYAQRQRRFGK